MKLKWNRKCSIFVLFMFITVTFASFNTNLFIDGNAYVRANDLVRITNIELVENTNQAYETYEPEYTSDTITINTNLPKQNSTAQYRITIQNNSDYDYDVQDIIEQTYSNNKISYNITGLTVDETVLESHTTSTFLLTLSNNTTITEEPDVYETKTFEFDYTGGEQEFTVPYTGDYTLEVWGAQGGTSTTTINSKIYTGGYGGYSKGTIHLNQNEKIYINVGGSGTTCTGPTCISRGGYNGGGDCKSYIQDYSSCGSGGGATHISKNTGELKTIEQFKGTLVNDDYYNSKIIYIVAGGGGGGAFTNAANNGKGGPGGGYKGGDATAEGKDSEHNGYGLGGTQTTPGYRYTTTHNQYKVASFGQGYSDTEATYGNTNTAGGGGGFFGGGGTYVNAAGGGSGYIASELLSNKEMYCYNCAESTAIQTKTTSTENHSQNPISNYAKEGNGYAKLTITRKIEDGSNYDFDYTGNEQTFNTPYTGIYKLETWGAQGGSYYENYIPYGGYSRGNIELNKNDMLYVYVGGAGKVGIDEIDGFEISIPGGYNGGGAAATWKDNKIAGSGGGATHIARSSGILSTLSNNRDSILIVSGGGGGFGKEYTDQNITYIPGYAGGYIGNNAYISKSDNWSGFGGTQNTGGSNSVNSINSYYGVTDEANFGKGASAINDNNEPVGNTSGGGGGYYGGGTGTGNGGYGGGGSSYIGNTLLTNKIMYCYSCEESQDVNTRTVSTLSHAKNPKKNFAKEGNGYSRITLVQRLSNNIELSLKFDIQRLTDYGITYDLDGGTISGQKTTYTRNTDTFTLPTPTKEGYTFAGWTGGKNMYNKEYILNNSRNLEDTSRIDAGWYRIVLNVKPNTKYTLSTNLPIRDDGGCYILINSADNYDAVMVSNTSGLSVDNPRTVTSTSNGHIVVAYNNSGYNMLKHSSDIYWAQLEEGDKNTANEQYISTPQSITITKGSRGYRTYKAVWQPTNYNIEYDLDGGTLSNSVNTYNIETNTFNLPIPTKEGYTFTGWTGGKNLIEIKNINRTVSGVSFTINNDKSITLNGLSTYNQNHAFGRTLYVLNKENNSNVPTIQLKANRGYVLNGGVWDDYRIECYQEGAIYFKSYKRVTEDSLTSCYIAIEGNKVFNNFRFYPQLEWGTEATPYEQYISNPNSSITISKGTIGNRIYHANWEPKTFNIEYDLDDGTISNQPTSYSVEDSSFTIPTPTKEGCEFLGWNGGKNLFHNTTYHINGTGTTQEIENDYIKVTPIEDFNSGIWMDFHTDKYKKYLTGKPVTISFELKSDVNKTIRACIDNTNPTCKTFNLTTTWERYSFTRQVMDYDVSRNLTIYNNNGSVAGSVDPYYIRNIQVEVGTQMTEYEPEVTSKQLSVTIPQGSKGNRVYLANWKDVASPTLSLTKRTYLGTQDIAWTINNGTMDSDGIVEFPAGAGVGNMKIDYLDVNNGSWWVTYEEYTEGVAKTEEDGTELGMQYISTAYFDENYDSIVAYETYSRNGRATTIPLNRWNSISAFDGYGTGSKSNLVKYLAITITGNGTYVVGPTKIRNVRVYGTKIPNSFYDIIITSSDNIGVTTTKYASGSHDANYFKTNGTTITDSSIRVTSNGTYTVYVVDAAGNATVQEIEITDIQ